MKSGLKRQMLLRNALKRLACPTSGILSHRWVTRSTMSLVPQKAGIPCVAVTYGYGSEKELGQVSPWRLVSSVAELGEYLLSLN